MYLNDFIKTHAVSLSVLQRAGSERSLERAGSTEISIQAGSSGERGGGRSLG